MGQQPAGQRRRWSYGWAAATNSHIIEECNHDKCHYPDERHRSQTAMNGMPDGARQGSREPSSTRVDSRFQTLIVQPATLCNLDCTYCYLPSRGRQTLMTVKVAQQLALSIEEQASVARVDVVWHGGEPLTTPVDHMRRLLLPFEPLRAAGRVRHFVQTNATLISPAWIEVFAEYSFAVGVSIDGPEAQNAGRVNRSGRPAFAQTMAGIDKLREAGIEFSAICVVTAETIAHADDLLAFFASLGCVTVGFNIEEREGPNTHREQVTPEQAETFWGRLWQLRPRYPGLHIRDLERFGEWLRRARSGISRVASLYDPIPTVSAAGHVVVLSPELLGTVAPAHRNFIVGNVLTESLLSIMNRLPTVGYVAEFERGLQACARTCEFWDFCRGGQASNRFFEHGRFDTTETNYCRTTYQAVVRSALQQIKGGIL